MAGKQNTTPCIEESEVKVAAMHLLHLSDETGSDIVNMVIQLIQTEIFKPDSVLQQITIGKDSSNV